MVDPGTERGRRLARRLRARCLQRGWDVSDLARGAGISRTTAHQLLSGETRQPHLRTLAKIAAALGVSVAELSGEAADFTASLLESGAAAFDRRTNPAVSDVAAESPRLFASWTPAEWDELYSTFGTGGALTPDGVRRTAEAINRKRETVRQLQVLLETHLAEPATRIVETLYRLVHPAGNVGPAADLQTLFAPRHPSDSESGEG